MSSVNLVPERCLERHTRRRRLRLWIGVCAAAGLVVCAAWVTQRLGSDRHTALRAALESRWAEQATVNQQLAQAQAELKGLAEQMRALLRLRAHRRLADQLAALAAAAPAETTIQELVGRTLTKQPVAPSAKKPGDAKKPETPAEVRSVQEVEVRGLARDHATLSRLIEALRQVDGWSVVELRSARAAERDSLEFEIVCRDVEAGS